MAGQWEPDESRGSCPVLRGAGAEMPRSTHVIVTFQYMTDAERYLSELKERFKKFKLELHPEKTRLIEFGRFAIAACKKHGSGKPKTFNFLGFVCHERGGEINVKQSC